MPRQIEEQLRALKEKPATLATELAAAEAALETARAEVARGGGPQAIDAATTALMSIAALTGWCNAKPGNIVLAFRQRQPK